MRVKYKKKSSNFQAGMINRALDLAFRTEQFNALDLITNELDENSDPRILERAAKFFITNQQYNKAVQLLAYLKKVSLSISKSILKYCTLHL